MPYPEEMCAPMRAELTSQGFTELRTAEEVENKLPNASGTSLLVINSVCGCAAGSARPAAIHAINNGKKPDNLFTVFAGQDLEATNEARKHTLPYPPSSPCIALFKDGKLVHFIERHHIEGSNAEMISENLRMAFDDHVSVAS
ncbi:MAG: BrxA/BrxB family bacilliredoxin [Bacteroidia bacterium]|nr:BrxA/BrxB family bacilliredoxin [Bacteroidia bacterium]NNC86450.1 BrxA/BrxB family bacilliredoxin [Bacteroidia bacterium]NNM16200.1 BrxA/BrxB family bacilliredoxin [Bacteroidia bacterium]